LSFAAPSGQGPLRREDSEHEPEPRPPYPAPYLEGLALFNRREFWECHEALEALWLPLSGGPKLFYQGIIQTAAAFHHVTHTGRFGGARKLFEEARKKLELFRPRYGGLDVDALLARVTRLRDVADEIDRGVRRGFDPALFFELRPESPAKE
jgi:hypothetical protein